MSVATGTAATYRRPTPAQTTATTRVNVTDDYERWYTEAAPNNRMLLSLRSGLDSEVAWALDRLCRLCQNEQFMLIAIPGLTDALFEWPEWYCTEGYLQLDETSSMFALPKAEERKRRHAIESLFILRNAAMHESNAHELSLFPRIPNLVLRTLHDIKPNTDANAEFMLCVMEILQTIAHSVTLPAPTAPPRASPVGPLQEIAGSSSNRSLVIMSLTTLTVLYSNPHNIYQLAPDAPALETAMNVLPLILDKELIDAALNYLYAHLSHPPMTRTFLLHPRMPGTLRLLVSLILADQMEENVSFEIGMPTFTAPAQSIEITNHELTSEELEHLLPMPEPQRCFEWMKTMFVARPEGELTQVDFWNLYKDVFASHQDKFGMLVASDVIKNVNAVFPQAQAMVLPGPPQRFVVRGVDRRQGLSSIAQFKCQWKDCDLDPFPATDALYEHLLDTHIQPFDGAQLPCAWGSCAAQTAVTKAQMRAHVLTHLPDMQPPAKHPSQPSTVTLPSMNYPHPVAEPTKRPPPPARATLVTYTRPHVDPPPSSLTALLCLRVLFRASFVPPEVTLRADESHFGFPGVGGAEEGQKAFMAIRYLLEDVRMKHETFQGWVTAMIDGGLTGQA
ncbi:uncharacterized protein BXZ73DRAFT_87167 [Epithele typhae]|uniref:uncharacterized protein n=1 Tax=Epithele typhae TaxID=378194 RepID=UPI002008A904|nr:uncharacterized protein BXZ73DRAFT_87167 [Epithele typhae]KAH9944224.1 hypothetical protein BXZ73DRAFT_87167 [Epithele typhae]